jgi:hypothetical protein
VFCVPVAMMQLSVWPRLPRAGAHPVPRHRRGGAGEDNVSGIGGHQTVLIHSSSCSISRHLVSSLLGVVSFLQQSSK